LVVLAAVVAVAVVPASAAVTSVPSLVHAPMQRQTSSRTATTSSNWSGYASYGTTFTDVRASWVQPTATCPRGRQFAAFWVGLDGYASNSVEQIGTDSDCFGTGRPVYYGWYEMYPAPAVNLPAGHSVFGGDTMTSEVSVTGSTYTLTLTDATHPWSFTTTQVSAGNANSSAEWIAEAPAACRRLCRVLPLANFGTVHFTNTTATATAGRGTISETTNDSIAAVTRRGVAKATPSLLVGGGTSFTDTWHHT
jgi:hypothetical protein